jgi:replicative DNA helicase
MAKEKKIAGAMQENVLAMLCTDDTHCQMVRHAIPLRLYSNEIFRTIASKAYDFIDAHGAAPKEHLPDLLEEFMSDGKEGRLYSEMVHGLRLLGGSLNTKYVVNQLTAFVQEHSLRLGIIEAAEALQNDDFEEARGLIESALRQSAPVFNPGTTLLSALGKMRRGEAVRDVIPCGVQEMDRRDLGPALGEMWMLVGAPKRGKTWGLIGVARSALMDRRKVLYITLEVSEEIIARRMVQSFTGYYARRSDTRDDRGKYVTVIPQLIMSETKGNGSNITRVDMRHVDEHDYLQWTRSERELGRAPRGIDKAIERIERLYVNDRLRIKSFPTGQLSVREFVTFLDQLERIEKFVADEVIIDYPDLMAIDKATYRISLGNILKDLRGVFVTRNIAGVVASQLNRPGSGTGYATEVDIAEDFSKIAVADTVAIMNQLPSERRFNLGRLYIAASRNENDRFSILMTQNYEIGQFSLTSRREPSNYRAFLRSIASGDSGAGDDETEEVQRPANDVRKPRVALVRDREKIK